MRKSCRRWKNAVKYIFARKIGFDTAEKEPSIILPTKNVFSLNTLTPYVQRSTMATTAAARAVLCVFLLQSSPLNGQLRFSTKFEFQGPLW